MRAAASRSDAPTAQHRRFDLKPVRVVGIDPGTVSTDLCGLEDGRVFLDLSLPTADAVRDPVALVERLERLAPLDLVAGPSGYGLPLVAAHDVSERDLRLACLAGPGEPGGIAGLRAVMRALSRARVPVVFTPGVIHLLSVPAHRKVNRIDLGTADKVCAAALAVHDHAARYAVAIDDVRLVMLELGGAFTASLAIDGGRIVDGAGGSSGAIGLRACGAMDAEVAFLAGTVSKGMVFAGGAYTVAGLPDDAALEALAGSDVAWQAWIEGAVKEVLAMCAAVRDPREVVLSGRGARLAAVREAIAARLARAGVRCPLHVLTGLTQVARSAAAGAALVADGLAGGGAAALVRHLGLREASGTVLDHLHVISRSQAYRRLGIAGTG